MSHLTERKEKNCLNCGAEVQGRFCQVCGQENIEPKESFWHLLTHFVYDVTHFDGKFFSTLRYLLFKPGFLSHEYLRGRRGSYLHPIRMYVFTSAFFFLIFFTVNKTENEDLANKHTAAKQMKRVEKGRASFLKKSQDTSRSVEARARFAQLVVMADSDIARLSRDTMYKNKLETVKDESNSNFLVTNSKDSAYKTAEEYELAQDKLPSEKRDGFWERKFRHRKIYLNQKYNHDGSAIWKAVSEKFTHLFPQMLFISLPLFALMLQLMYLRKTNFYYVNHVVFTIHLYCGTFIIILAGMLVNFLLKQVGYEGDWDGTIFFFAGLFYWYKSMRNFYEQRRAKTILKYILVMIISLIMMSFLFVFFFVFSAMAI